MNNVIIEEYIKDKKEIIGRINLILIPTVCIFLSLIVIFGILAYMIIIQLKSSNEVIFGKNGVVSTGKKV